MHIWTKDVRKYLHWKCWWCLPRHAHTNTPCWNYLDRKDFGNVMQLLQNSEAIAYMYQMRFETDSNKHRTNMVKLAKHIKYRVFLSFINKYTLKRFIATLHFIMFLNLFRKLKMIRNLCCIVLLLLFQISSQRSATWHLILHLYMNMT
jgi:hypothetical protein